MSAPRPSTSRRPRRDAVHAARRRRAAAVPIPALGRLSVHNGLAAAATGLAAGLTLEAIAAGLADGWSAPHRVALVRLGDVTVIDDSYNASPGSMRAALELLARPARAAASRSSARCSSSATRTTTATAPSARPPAGSPTCSSSSAPARPALVEGARDAGLAPGADPPRRRRGRGARGPASAAARRRRRPRQGARAGIGLDAARRRRCAPSRCQASPDDRRADPGPAARVRARRHPHAAVHPAAPGRRASASASARRGPRATTSRRARPRWAAS